MRGDNGAPAVVVVIAVVAAAVETVTATLANAVARTAVARAAVSVVLVTSDVDGRVLPVITDAALVGRVAVPLVVSTRGAVLLVAPAIDGVAAVRTRVALLTDVDDVVAAHR